MIDTCDTCGSKVKIVGNTTKHYEPIEESEELARLRAENLELRQALELIAAPKRVDGTYNRSREALEECAKVLGHAQALTYFSEGGSTASWANDALENLKQAKQGMK